MSVVCLVVKNDVPGRGLACDGCGMETLLRAGDQDFCPVGWIAVETYGPHAKPRHFCGRACAISHLTAISHLAALAPAE